MPTNAAAFRRPTRRTIALVVAAALAAVAVVAVVATRPAVRPPVSVTGGLPDAVTARLSVGGLTPGTAAVVTVYGQHVRLPSDEPPTGDVCRGLQSGRWDDAGRVPRWRGLVTADAATASVPLASWPVGCVRYTAVAEVDGRVSAVATLGTVPWTRGEYTDVACPAPPTWGALTVDAPSTAGPGAVPVLVRDASATGAPGTLTVEALPGGCPTDTTTGPVGRWPVSPTTAGTLATVNLPGRGVWLVRLTTSDGRTAITVIQPA